MAYKDFSIESAVSPSFRRPSVKLQGVANAVRIMRNPSRSTEDYIQGAITSVGAANRQSLYVSCSLEALNDRLRVASKIAYAVNTSKRRGAEGFNDVPMMNPWEFALEDENSKGSGFFTRIWDAIKTACRRIIDAIAHLIKYIANAIASADVKSQIKHYKLWTQNSGKAKDLGTDVTDKKFKAPSWKLNYKGVSEFITKCESEYGKFVKTNTNSPDVDALKNISRKNTIDDSVKSLVGKSNTVNSKATADEMLKSLISAVFGSTTDTSAHKLVLAKFCGTDKDGEITCKDMKSKSDEFKCLAEEGLAKQCKNAISLVHGHQKAFTEYTKLIDKAASVLSKDTKKAAGKDKDAKKNASTDVRQINNYVTQLANSRIRCNSFATSMMLEVQMFSLRFNKSAHIALKHYLRGMKAIKSEGDEEKTSEAYVSTESLFQF